VSLAADEPDDDGVAVTVAGSALKDDEKGVPEVRMEEAGFSFDSGDGEEADWSCRGGKTCKARLGNGRICREGVLYNLSMWH